MKVRGFALLHATRSEVWKALNDPAVLSHTIPGCQRLEETGPDAYAMAISAGVASIKGTYNGDVALTDQQEPESFVLRASGVGAPGTVSADVQVSLTEQDDGQTRVDYDADAIVGGMIGGVGQRMLTGVAKKMAGEFFSAVDDVLTGAATPSAAVAGESTAAEAGTSETGQRAPLPGAYHGVSPGDATPGRAPSGSDEGLVPGLLAGAGVALLGVLVGGWVAGRRRG